MVLSFSATSSASSISSPLERDKWGRFGRYHLDRFIERVEAMASISIDHEVTADCQRKPVRNDYDPWGARCPDLPKLAWRCSQRIEPSGRIIRMRRRSASTGGATTNASNGSENSFASVALVEKLLGLVDGQDERAPPSRRVCGLNRDRRPLSPTGSREIKRNPLTFLTRFVPQLGEFLFRINGSVRTLTPLV
jgi:hypothetical protein